MKNWPYPSNDPDWQGEGEGTPQDGIFDELMKKDEPPTVLEEEEEEELLPCFLSTDCIAMLFMLRHDMSS
jgi:hypothetical protein